MRLNMALAPMPGPRMRMAAAVKGRSRTSRRTACWRSRPKCQEESSDESSVPRQEFPGATLSLVEFPPDASRGSWHHYGSVTAPNRPWTVTARGGRPVNPLANVGDSYDRSFRI